MEFLDTQIISYKFKNNTELFDGDIHGRYISSIVALEFLGIMIKDKNKATMYPMRIKGFHSVLPFFQRQCSKHSVFWKQSTDQVIIDFNGEFDSIIIYSNETISKLINEKDLETLLYFAKSALDKEAYKKFRERALFLINNNISVVPLTPAIISIMQHIYEDIKHEYNIKDNYRNSFMDLLIVATAVEKKRRLISKDKELNKILERNCDYLYVAKNAEGLLYIDCYESQHPKSLKNGNKGYINNSWSVLVKNKII